MGFFGMCVLMKLNQQEEVLLSSPGTVLIIDDETITFLVTELGVQKIMISPRTNVEKHDGQVYFLDEEQLEYHTIH